MEGGSPRLIWERWDLPTYYAQLRYWGDHPRLEQLAAAFFKIKPKKTPPPRADGRPAAAAIDPALFDAPLSPAERGQPSGPATPIR